MSAINLELEKLNEVTDNLANVIGKLEEYHAVPMVSVDVLSYIKKQAKHIKFFVIVSLVILLINLILEVAQFYI